VLWS